LDAKTDAVATSFLTGGNAREEASGAEHRQTRALRRHVSEKRAVITLHLLERMDENIRRR